MSIPKDTIKRWMKERRVSREWLAEQCGVEKRTVDNWLSTQREIPSKAQMIINKLMAENEYNQPSAIAPQPECIFSLRVTEEQFDAYNRAALAEGKTIREWITDALNEAAETEYISPSQIVEEVDAQSAQTRHAKSD